MRDWDMGPMCARCHFCKGYGDLEPCHYDGKDIAACYDCAEREERAFDVRLSKDPNRIASEKYVFTIDAEDLSDPATWYPIFVRYGYCLYLSGYH